MHLPARTACIMAILFTACRHRASEPELAGQWEVGCSIDICTIINLAPDHTFALRFEDSDSPYASGDWRLDQGYLVMRTLSTRVPDMKADIGKERRVVISQLQSDRLVLTPTEDPKTPLTWKRLP